MPKYQHCSGIRVKNKTGKTVTISLAHSFGKSSQPLTKKWKDVKNNETTPADDYLKAFFNTGVKGGATYDWWWINVEYDGKCYYCNGKECYLKDVDSGQILTFEVSLDKFHLNMNSSSCTGSMSKW